MKGAEYFVEKNTIWQKILKRYFINGLNGMALGLFCTLIVGLIIKQIGTFIGGDVGTFIVALGNFATMCTGAAIGVGTAYVMEAPRMVVFSSAVTGLLGANAAAFANGTLFPETGGMLLSGAGDPLGAPFPFQQKILSGKCLPQSLLPSRPQSS